MYTVLEDNRSHAIFCVGVSHEISVIFSNAKNQAWPQHKHLHAQENFKSTIEYQSSYGFWSLPKWLAVCTGRCQTGHRTMSSGERKLSWRQETAAKLAHAELSVKQWTDSHYKLTSQNTTCEMSSALWNNLRRSILLIVRVVAGHGSVSQQSIPKDTVRGPPTQCWISKTTKIEAGHPPHSYNCTYMFQRVSLPLLFVQWAIFFKSMCEAYPLHYTWVLLP